MDNQIYMFVPTSFVLKFHTIFTQKGRDEKVGSGHWNQTYFLFRFSQVHFHYDHRRYCNCNVLIIVSIATHKHDFPNIIMLNTIVKSITFRMLHFVFKPFSTFVYIRIKFHQLLCQFHIHRNLF